MIIKEIYVQSWPSKYDKEKYTVIGPANKIDKQIYPGLFVKGLMEMIQDLQVM
jgi:hypothetical protein